MLLKFGLVYINLGAPLRALRRTAELCHAMRRAVEGRRALAQMDARMLADIGISRAEAQAEISRKPWDISPRR